MGIVWSVIGIFLCGGLGGLAAWTFVTTAGWGGAAGAIAAAIIGMVVAVALWTGLTVLLRAMGLVR